MIKSLIDIAMLNERIRQERGIESKRNKNRERERVGGGRGMCLITVAIESLSFFWNLSKRVSTHTHTHTQSHKNRVLGVVKLRRSNFFYIYFFLVNCPSTVVKKESKEKNEKGEILNFFNEFYFFGNLK